MNKKTDGYWYLESDNGWCGTARYLKTLVKLVRQQENYQLQIQYFRNDRVTTDENQNAFWLHPEMTDDQIITRALAARDAVNRQPLPKWAVGTDVVYLMTETDD